MRDSMPNFIGSGSGTKWKRIAEKKRLAYRRRVERPNVGAYLTKFHIDKRVFYASSEQWLSRFRSIQKNKNIPRQNKLAVMAHVTHLKAIGRKPGTIAKHLYELEKFLVAIGKIKVWHATKHDIEGAMAQINALPLAEKTKLNIAIVIKVFYKHLLGEDRFYPRRVEWIRGTNPKQGNLLPEDLLSESDIIKMLETVKNPRNRAIIALLYDSGIRDGELLSLRRKDINLDSEPVHIMVDGKTGMRQIPILFSVSYLAQYINANVEMKPDDPLWCRIGSQMYNAKPVNRQGISAMLKRAAKRAGIPKRVYPHLFRHSRATYYANKLTEPQLKKFFGWVPDSNMTETYVHLSGRDIDGAVLKANGIDKVREQKTKLKWRVCLRCRSRNTPDAVYCNMCAKRIDPNIFRGF